MSLIPLQHKASVRLKLARDHLRKIKQGFPWIYDDCLTDRPKASAGSRALVRDQEGILLAFGMYDPDSPLSVRVCAVEREVLDDKLIEIRLDLALRIRRGLFAAETTRFRLLNGEGDR